MQSQLRREFLRKRGLWKEPALGKFGPFPRTFGSGDGRPRQGFRKPGENEGGGPGFGRPPNEDGRGSPNPPPPRKQPPGEPPEPPPEKPTPKLGPKPTPQSGQT
ncbi:MAG: hypothetical protein QM775_00315 [Pirellulales bacterium]